jgi:tetratricopeptide (TPR) repeat protein
MKILATKHFFVCVLLICTNLYSSAQSNFYQANYHFEKEEYELAIPFYSKLVKNDPSAENIEKLAQCYYYLKDYLNAEIYYRQLLAKTKPSQNSIYQFANSLQKNEHYEEAIKQYESFLNNSSNQNKKILLQIESCRQSILWKSEFKGRTLIENVKSINSEYDEAGISIGKGLIYFSSSRKLHKIFDEVNAKTIQINNYALYTCKYTNINDLKSYKTISELKLQGIKDNDDIAHPSLNSEENVCYFSSSYSYSAGSQKFEKHKPETYTEINVKLSKRIDNKWSYPEVLFNHSSINYQILHPCLSADGKRLYFSSNMSGGYGSYDLYYIEKNENNGWSSPVNLGNMVNTEDNEFYPSYANDSVLFFSSNGHIGMGDLDILEARLKDSKVVSVSNLKYPINSSYNDHSYVPGTYFTSGLFCSDRPGGLGMDDIYYFKRKK